MPDVRVVPRLTSVCLVRRIALTSGADLWVPQGTHRALVWSPPSAPLSRDSWRALKNSLRHPRACPPIDEVPV